MNMRRRERRKDVDVACTVPCIGRERENATGPDNTAADNWGMPTTLRCLICEMEYRGHGICTYISLLVDNNRTILAISLLGENIGKKEINPWNKERKKIGLFLWAVCGEACAPAGAKWGCGQTARIDTATAQDTINRHSNWEGRHRVSRDSPLFCGPLCAVGLGTGVLLFRGTAKWHCGLACPESAHFIFICGGGPRTYGGDKSAPTDEIAQGGTRLWAPRCGTMPTPSTEKHCSPPNYY